MNNDSVERLTWAANPAGCYYRTSNNKLYLNAAGLFEGSGTETTTRVTLCYTTIANPRNSGGRSMIRRVIRVRFRTEFCPWADSFPTSPPTPRPSATRIPVPATPPLSHRERGVVPAQYFRDTGRHWEWYGAASLGGSAYNSSPYFVPHSNTYVLQLDRDSGDAVSGAGVASPQGQGWAGAVVVGTKLYCAPMSGDTILVFDTLSSTTTHIPAPPIPPHPLGQTDQFKWSGAAAVGDSVFFSPYDNNNILALDTLSSTPSLVATGRPGRRKWAGAVGVGGSAYFAPRNEDDVLKFDGNTVSFIPSGRTGDGKWLGAAAVGPMVYLCPYKIDVILELDTRNSATSFIPTDHTAGHSNVDSGGDGQWTGVTAVGSNLYFAPRNNPDILELDTCTRIVSSGGWAGATSVGPAAYFAPHELGDILALVLPSVPSCAPPAGATAVPIHAGVIAGCPAG
eukprot:gene20165-biopygen61873